jgi:D-beta-D-heptose 7-phosphate kinase/D-beta-D-heptose 1-phosphate adenosyltransferase
LKEKELRENRLVERSLHGVVRAFQGVRVLVVGDAILDRWLHGESTRLSREAPVPVLDLDERLDVPGGAANAALNLAALGADVRLLAAVGADAEGEALRGAVAAGGVDVAPVVVAPERTTLAKHRLTAGSQQLLRFDQGTVDPLGGATERALIDRALDLLEDADALVVSDYESGVRTEALVAALAARRAHGPDVWVVDARSPAAWRALRPTAVKPNYAEAARLLGLPQRGNGGRADLVAAHGDRLLDLTGAGIAAVTLDADGSIILERGQPAYRTYAVPTDLAGSTGCGDTYTAALTLALTCGAGTVGAAELASAAAGVVVRKPGTSVCSAAELGEDPTATKRVPSPATLTALVRSHRLAGRRIVFTNGCFDILHRGHVTYLSRAKALGDVLVVAVNGDESVRRLKGEARPVNPLEDRLEVLAALSCVDHVVAFDDDSPTELLRAARPDVYAKGGDYTRETLPEAALVESLGGSVELLDYLDDRSTSGIIARIATTTAAGTRG